MATGSLRSHPPCRQEKPEKQEEEEEEKKRKPEEDKQEERAQASRVEGMEKLCSYIKESCILDSIEGCETAAKTVIAAPNSYEGMLQVMALMTAMVPGIQPIEAFHKARMVINAACRQNIKPSLPSNGSVTLSMSLPSEALDLVRFHTSHDQSHTSQDISSQFSSIISGGSSHSPSTYQGWGKLASKSPVDDDSFPKPSTTKLQNTLWPEKQWDEVLSQKTIYKNRKSVIVSVETKLNDLIGKQKQRIKPRCVTFVFAKATGKLCGEKRPDFYLTMAATETPTPETVGAILFTQSTTQTKRYDSDAAVGEAVALGQQFLANTSKSRSFIIVGVTNLKAVRWFKVSKSGSAFCYLRCSETANVAGSLAGYMCSSPEKLGLTSLVVKVGTTSYTLGRFLGEGHTSNVHVVTVNNKHFAVKVPKAGINLSSDVKYLKMLHGIKGIPAINSDYSNAKAVFTEPVCSQFTAEVLFKERLQPHLAKLVDTLKCAHDKKVVNRDVRVENIMVADRQFVIVDWGYAAILSVPVSYAGTTYLACPRVLKLLEEGTTTFASEACDDLVSLVQSLSLLVRRNEEWQNRLYALSKVDYAGIRKFWEEYFGFPSSPSDLLKLAQNTNYLELKKCIESWALTL